MHCLFIQLAFPEGAYFSEQGMTASSSRGTNSPNSPSIQAGESPEGSGNSSPHGASSDDMAAGSQSDPSLEKESLEKQPAEDRVSGPCCGSLKKLRSPRIK